MGRIFYLMGKSSTGKDTIYRHLIQNQQLHLKQVVTYTTRPIRVGERDGRDYYFIDESKLRKLESEGRIVEMRAYDTFHGVWKYLTVDDGRISAEDENYLMIGTLVSYEAMCRHYGQDKMVPILIALDDGIRLQRALDREKKQEIPKYEELCRRFLADAQDYAPEKIQKAGIEISFYNKVFDQCLGEVSRYIEERL